MPAAHPDDKTRHLVVHDYGMGSLCWWVHARSPQEIMERVADVIVVLDPETLRDAETRDYEEVDLDAPDPNPLTDLKATRTTQRRQPGFGAVVGRGTVWFRCPWKEFESQAPWWDDDNAAYFLLELGEDGYRTREVVEYTSGPSHRMSEADWFFNPPFDLYRPEWAKYEIDQAAFEAAWNAAIPLPADEDEDSLA